MDDLHNKKKLLENYISSAGKIAVAYSAGVDSTFLLKTASNIPGVTAFAITVRSAFFPQEEADRASEFCKKENIEQIIIDFDVMGKDEIIANPYDRCYHCKKAIFEKVREKAEEKGISVIYDGTNSDDINDFRPGMKALEELGIESPLLRLGIRKSEIRALSAEMGLDTADKPSLACLASRIPYGDRITEDKLEKAEKGERFLREQGFGQLRLRIHGNIARIEIAPEDFDRFSDTALRNNISAYLHGLGLDFVTLDLDGYRTGSLNPKGHR